MSFSETTIKPLISSDEISKRLSELAIEIKNSYKDKKLTIVAVLEGAFIFAADLIRLLPEDWDLRFISVRASSYLDDLISGGNVNSEKTSHLNLIDRHVLIVDDIVTTGLSLEETGRKVAADNILYFTLFRSRDPLRR